MGIIVFIKRDETDSAVWTEFADVNHLEQAFEELQKFGPSWRKYQYAVWFDDLEQRSVAETTEDLWDDIMDGNTIQENTWCNTGTYWENLEDASYDVAFPEVDVPVVTVKPKGKVPDLPVEVWNPRKINTALAMNVMRDLCKGQAGA